MDYIDRLLLRARAVPREGAGALFDPFDRWAPAEATDEPARVMAVAPVNVAAPMPATLQPSQPVIVDVVQRIIDVEPSGAAMNIVAPLVSATMSSATPSLPAPATVIPAAAGPVPQRPASAVDEVVARADAFMRGLGVAPARQPEATPTPAAAIETARSARRLASALPSEPPAARAAPQPARILPIAPTPIPTTPRREPRAARDPAPPAPAPATTPARPDTRPTPERIAATTVVITRDRGRALDELAHSSGMARFGLGQW